MKKINVMKVVGIVVIFLTMIVIMFNAFYYFKQEFNYLSYINKVSGLYFPVEHEWGFGPETFRVEGLDFMRYRFTYSLNVFSKVAITIVISIVLGITSSAIIKSMKSKKM